MIRRFSVITAIKMTNANSAEQHAAKISTAHLGIVLIGIVEM
jgi:hypothetical protein